MAKVFAVCCQVVVDLCNIKNSPRTFAELQICTLSSFDYNYQNTFRFSLLFKF